MVYAVDSSDRVRQAQAIARFERACANDTVALSTQVLHEFYSIVTTKLRPPLSTREASAQVRQLCAFHVAGSSSQSVQDAIELAQKHKLHWWDALILESALRIGADVLVSQDGQHGQRFGKLVVENPFLAA